MNYIRYIVAIILGVCGIWIIILNWLVFVKGYIKKKDTPSWIPLLGGCFLCVAFAIIPSNLYSWLCWLAFIIDWGSLPGITFSIWHHIKESRSNK